MGRGIPRSKPSQELEIFHGALRNTEDNDAMNAFFYLRDSEAFVENYKQKILDSGAK